MVECKIFPDLHSDKIIISTLSLPSLTPPGQNNMFRDVYSRHLGFQKAGGGEEKGAGGGGQSEGGGGMGQGSQLVYLSTTPLVTFFTHSRFPILHLLIHYGGENTRSEYSALTLPKYSQLLL